MKLTRAVLYTGSASAAALLALPGCLHVKTDPIKVEPIHIVADINIRVERQLEDFFAFEKQTQTQTTTTTTTTPPVDQ